MLQVVSIGIILLVCGAGAETLCPDAWVADRGSCYLFNEEHVTTFTEAEHYCEQHHSHLAIVNDADENNFLKAFLHRLKPTGWWIGLTDDIVEGEWRWTGTDEKATFFDWAPGEPAGPVGQDEDCVSMYYDTVTFGHQDFQWVDISCTGHRHPPICEREVESEITG